jgi:hypothetical protein
LAVVVVDEPEALVPGALVVALVLLTNGLARPFSFQMFCV